MVSNGERYKPLQVHPQDHADFKELCEKLKIPQTQGFTLALQSWKLTVGEIEDEVSNV